MSHSLRMRSPDTSANESNCLHIGTRAARRPTAWLACCVFAFSAPAIPTPAAAAGLGCVSGNVGVLLSSPDCQATQADFDAVAVGFGATATGQHSTAFGDQARATQDDAVAVGNGAAAVGFAAAAVGGNAQADGATAVGVFSFASGLNSTAIGGGDLSNGNGALADNIFGVAIGTSAVATGVRATSIGAFAGANPVGAGNNRNSSFGEEAGQKVNGAGNTATGLAAGFTVTGDLNTATGNASGSLVAGSNNTAEGVLAGNNVSGFSNAAFGDSAGNHVTGSGNVAIGQDAGTHITANSTVAVGFGAIASVDDAVAIGPTSMATTQNALAVGFFSRATGAQAIVVGADGQASKNEAVAIGTASLADAPFSLALGPAAKAMQNGSVALGSNSVANAANTVSVGRGRHERRIVNVATAVNGTDAVNLAQVQALIAGSAHVAGLTPVLVRATPANGQSPNGSGRIGSSGPNGQRPMAHVTPAGGLALSSQSSERTTAAPTAAAAPVTAVSCETSGAKVTTAIDDASTSSTSFAPIAQTAISFQQGGTTNGCVNLSFSAESLAPGATLMEVRAVLNGSIEGSPGRVYFAQGDDVLRAHAFNFLFPNVPPGPHRVEVHFRSIGEPGTVRVGMRTTMVQYAR